MSLKQTIDSGVDLAFALAGDLVGTFTLNTSESEYDVQTRRTNESVTATTGQGVFGTVDDTTLQDRSLVGLSLEVVYLRIGERPTIGSKLVGPDAIEYEIIRVKPVRSYDKIYIYEVLVVR